MTLHLRAAATAALLMVLNVGAQADDLRTAMARLQRQHDVSFVYDSSLPLGADYDGPALDGRPLDEQLRLLFARTNITYRIDGRHVLLRLSKPAATATWTLSGTVSDAQGEALINATVYDLTTRQGTTTNAYGFYSLTLPAGAHELRYSYVGYAPQLVHVDLAANASRNVRLDAAIETVGGVTIDGDLNSPVLTTQTGRRTLTPHDLRAEYALLSSPDVVKRLHTLSGVAPGIELLSGMYVHGGGADENLFLLDGTPLYQINHALGLFSSFNTDVIKNVDFYKSGFPARYGGRLSSVIDVRTADGDMERWHGLYAIGLIDGRFQIEGPIVPQRTSLNIGLRRTWSDLVMRTALGIANHFNDEEKLNVGYNFHDLNLNLTHILNDRQRLSLRLYSGGDALRAKDDWDSSTDSHMDLDLMDNRLRWGNLNATLDWRSQLSPRLMADVAAVYAHNSTSLRAFEDWRYGDPDAPTVNHTDQRYSSTIDDLGLRADFDLRPQPRHHIRFGGAYTAHLFRPQTRSMMAFFGGGSDDVDTLTTSSRNHQPAHELTAYGEDELRLSDRWSLNAGVHADLFAARGHAFLTADPRLAVKRQLGSRTSLKASYTWMTQQMHRLQNSFIDLPTDYWVPTTRRVPPMRSQQVSVGVYSEPVPHLMLMAELYYKRSRGLLQYNNWIGLEPPADAWDRLVEQGRGRSYGMDLDLRYHKGHVELDAAYTLSRTERRFPSVSAEWFPDKFDNRHKLNLALRLHWRRTEMYAAWTYHTGNRITVPEHYAALPVLPDGSAHHAYELGNAQLFYTMPNNATLPAYHRLDLGWNFHHTTKAGHERIWNLSVYNAYCRMNPLYADVSTDDDGRFRVKAVGFVPVVPSVSYTIKW